MKIFARIAVLVLFFGFSGSLLALQREDDDDGFKQRQGGPSGETAEWTFARFHYPMPADGAFRGFRRWAADYPKSDRQFVMGVKRLTRLDTRAVEEVTDPNSDEIFNWPWMFVEDAGAWTLNQAQADRMRQYLLRGGFMMFDDTHGDYEWQVMMDGLRMIFPDRTVEDLRDDDEIFHIFYDLDHRFQIPGTRFIWGGRRYTADSAVPKWRAIRDDRGRIMVAICHNSDVGDAWEWADSPRYPQPPMELAYRIGINYILYSMTH